MIDFIKLKKLLKYQDRYEISIQFWPDHTTIFIAKDGVDLESWGSKDDHFAVDKALDYLNRINNKSK